jgi:hypothetical protein
MVTAPAKMQDDTYTPRKTAGFMTQVFLWNKRGNLQHLRKLKVMMLIESTSPPPSSLDPPPLLSRSTPILSPLLRRATLPALTHILSLSL